jgi:hypothetical protein
MAFPEDVLEWNATPVQNMPPSRLNNARSNYHGPHIQHTLLPTPLTYPFDLDLNLNPTSTPT